MNTLVVIFLLGIASTEFKFWLTTTPLRDSDRSIVLADGHLFCKMPPEQAGNNAKQLQRSLDQYSSYVCERRGFLAYLRWAEGCRNRIEVWKFYSHYLQEHRPWHYRLYCLYQMKEYLGSDAFYAGLLPDPTPDL